MAEELEGFEDTDLTEDTTEEESGETENTGEDSEESEEESTDEEEETEEETEEEEKPEGKAKGTEKKEKEEEEPLDKPIYKKVKEKYPNLFKDFPQLRHDFFRGQEFSKLFPTVEDAKETKTAAKSFEFVRDELSEGRIGKILEVVGKNDYGTFKSLAQDFLPTLYQLDQDTYLEVSQPIIEQALTAAFKQGETTGNKNLQIAAQWIKKFLFGTHEFKAPEERREDPEKSRLMQERDGLLNQRRSIAEAEVHTYVNEEMQKLVSEGLDIDGVSDFQKRKISEEVINRVNQVLSKDPEHMEMMNSLWRRLHKTLDPTVQSKIANIFLSKAKELIPEIRVKVKKEALGSKTTTKKEPRRPGSGGNSNSSGKAPAGKNIDWSKTSDEDYLNNKITYLK